MRIGVDATCWANGRGYGRFTREIIPAMAASAPGDEFVCFLDPLSETSFGVGLPNIRKVVVSDIREAPVRAASAATSRSLHDMLRLTNAVRAARLDVFFSPAVYSYFPLPPGLRAVVTIHDAIPEKFPDLTLPSWRARLFWKLKVRLAIMQARRILTVSDYAANDLVRILGIPRDRIAVATEAASATFYPAAGESLTPALAHLVGDRRWFTYVGGFNPHKNVPVLIRAHAAVSRELGNVAPILLLVGTRNRDEFFSEVPTILSEIERQGTGSLVKWTGFLEDDILRSIHSRSVGLILPSDTEGFGLPAVEAAACGSPIIATRESPLPELLAGGGFFLAPRDENALMSAMRDLATNDELHRRLGQAALERARRLTWEHSAAAALASIREAAA
jgi:glycosyltransferase involved in cell wall biosynthesis